MYNFIFFYLTTDSFTAGTKYFHDLSMIVKKTSDKISI